MTTSVSPTPPAAEPHNLPSNSTRNQSRAFLAAAFLLLLPFCLLGYGSDNDTFSVLDAGRSTWHLHIPVTSRNPGYWLFEAITFVFSSLGGYLLTNLVTLTLALILLHRFLTLARRLGVRSPYQLAGCLLVTPVFLIAATSTDDYVWSLLGIVLSAEVLLAPRRSPLLAIFPAAFAFAARGANGVVIGGLIAGAIAADMFEQRRITRRALHCLTAGLGAALLGGLPYVESWRLADHTFDFLHSLRGPDAMWSLPMHLGRFLYKPLFLFGPIAILILILACFRPRRSAPAPSQQVVDFRSHALPMFAGTIAANTLLFLAWPIEISYLLPAAFFLLLILGWTLLARNRMLTVAFFAATFSLNLATPQLAQPNLRGHATSARFLHSLRPGQTVADVHLRLLLRRCQDLNCYLERFPQP